MWAKILTGLVWLLILAVEARLLSGKWGATQRGGRRHGDGVVSHRASHHSVNSGWLANAYVLLGQESL